MTIHIQLDKIAQLIGQATSLLDDVQTSLPADDPAASFTSRDLQDRGELAAIWQQSLTDWPRLRADIEPFVSTAFDSQEFQDRYHPGDTRLVYVGACAGLRRIATGLHVPIFKVGSCAAGGLTNRIRQLRREPYGSAWFRNDRYVLDSDFDSWFASLIQTRLVPTPASPVQITPRAYAVTLPDTMTAEQFETRLQDVMDPAKLFRWLESSDGISHCNAFGFDPNEGRRSTPYNRGDRTQLAPSHEIYVFRYQSDFDRLLTALERIILDEVLR